MSYQYLLYQAQDRVATITLNRPEVRNAMSLDLQAELNTALQTAGADPGVNVIVLTGVGNTFSAGGDLQKMDSQPSIVEFHESRSNYIRLLTTIRSLPKPLVARVNGHVMGGAMGIVALSDFAIAADTAKFGTPELNVGLFPMMVAKPILMTLPRRKAMELIFTARTLQAAEAAEWGLINRAVPEAELDATVKALVDNLLKHSPMALKLGREAMQQAEELRFAEALPYLKSMLAILRSTDDVVEGLTAFRERRAPVWKGR